MTTQPSTAPRLPVIVTKVRPPRRRKDLVSRTRLVEYLSSNADRKLVLVSAPPGYGKTTLMVDFLHESGIPACWYRLDDADTDLAVFFEHLVASLRQRYPGVCEQTLKLLESEGPADPESLVGSLINEITEEIDEFFLLVLDDYQRLDDAVLVNAAVDFLLRYLPDNCRLVVLSRTLPKKLTLTRLASEGAVVGVGQEHLKFRPDEIRALVGHLHDESLSIAEAQGLADRSEGWIAALVMGSERLLDGVRTGLAEPVAERGQLYDFLAREVINKQPEDVVRFLRETAILEAMCPDLCDAVREADDSAEMLERMEENNLFVQRIQGDGNWYRYHQLFQDFLLANLREDPPPDLPDRHRRAAAWFAAAGQPDMEIDHLVAAGDYETAADRIEAAMDYGVNSGRWRTMVRWIEALPRELRENRPNLMRCLGVCQAYLGHLPESLAALAKAINQLDEQGDARQTASALISRSYTWRYMSQVDAAVADAKRALDLAGEDRAIAGRAHRALGACYSLRGDMDAGSQELHLALEAFEAEEDPRNAAFTHSDLSAMYQLAGDVEQSLFHADRAIRYWRQVGNLPSLALALNNAGTAYHAQGRFDEAAELLHQATLTAQRAGDRRTLALALIGMADVESDLDDLTSAAKHYEQGLEIARAMGEGNLMCYGLAMLAETKRLLGDLSRAQELLVQAREELTQQRWAFESALVEFVRGAVALERRQFEPAAEHLDDAARGFAAMGSTRELAKTHLYRAAVFHRSGNMTDADHAWRQAVEAIRKFGYREAFRPQLRRLPEVFARDKIRRADHEPAPLFPEDQVAAAHGEVQDGVAQDGAAAGQAGAALGPGEAAVAPSADPAGRPAADTSGAETDEAAEAEAVEAPAARAATGSEGEVRATEDDEPETAIEAPATPTAADVSADAERAADDGDQREPAPGVTEAPTPSEPARPRVLEPVAAESERANPEAPASTDEPPPSMSVRAFGPPRILIHGEPVDPKAWETSTARDLFLYLLDRPAGAPRDQVLLAFWPDSTMPRATSAFHSTLHRIRRVLGKEIVRHQGDRYYANAPEDLDYDVARFEALFEEAKATEGDPGIALLHEATELVQGEYLQGMGSEWARERADQLIETIVDANLALAGRSLKSRRPADAVKAYRRALELDPLREDIHRALMRAYTEAGDRIKALQHYESLVELLDDELGIAPDAATQALHETIRDGQTQRASAG